MNYLFLYAITGLALLVSLFLDREKSFRAVKIAINKLINILPAFLTMLVLLSIVLYLIPEDVILTYLGSTNRVAGVLIAALLGSIIFMPGFIAFPLAGILLQKGVPYMVLSAFTTTLMMVGVLSYPVEKAYFGSKVTIIRNTLSFFIALVVAVITGSFFGEIF
jgi:uncharacterized membrane protein YraQ (UPF0718 family)